MAPVRRRVSRRVVKSTFQECFEYDIPGFRGGTPKRVSGSLLTNRTSGSSGKVKCQTRDSDSKQEVTQKPVKATGNNIKGVLKTKSLPRKEKLIEVTLKRKLKTNTIVTGKPNENLSKLRSSVVKRLKAKNAFMGSDYKRFKSPQTKNKLKDHASSAEVKKAEENTSSHSITNTPTSVVDSNKNTSASVGSVDLSKWQPVVHLEKISVNKTSPSKSLLKSREVLSGRRRVHSSGSSSSDLVIRLQNALKDPLAKKGDSNSPLFDHKMSTRMLSEVSKGTQSAEVSSSGILLQQVHRDSANVTCREKRNLNSKVLEGVFRHGVSPSNQTTSDSALEDWPDDSSDDSDTQQLKGDVGVNDISSAENDWASPHVSLLMDWQDQFKYVTNDLKNSFNHLKSIIEEKNASIEMLRRKLESYNDNTYHNILNHIIQDFDENDVNNPATVILNSILEYSNSYC